MIYLWCRFQFLGSSFSQGFAPYTASPQFSVSSITVLASFGKNLKFFYRLAWNKRYGYSSFIGHYASGSAFLAAYWAQLAEPFIVLFSSQFHSL